MKYLFILFSLLCLPASSFGQGVDMSFTKGKTSFILKITNETTDDIFVRNTVIARLIGSVLMVSFLDGNGKLLYIGEWGLGKEAGFWIKKGEVKQFDYGFSGVGIDLTQVKKVQAQVFFRYIIEGSGSFSQTENFECSF